MPRKKLAKTSPSIDDDARQAAARIARAPSAGDLFPLKLTEKQRGTLLHCTRLKTKIKHLLQDAGEGTQVVQFARQQLDDLDEELFQAAEYVPHPHKARLVAVLRKVNDLLAADPLLPSGDDASTTSGVTKVTAARKSDSVYQFRINLYGISPSVWRRIQVPDCTLADFHDYIQGAFGWWEEHLHEFIIDFRRYGPLPEETLFYDDEVADETTVRLSKLIPKSARRLRWKYVYDFGDNWRHDIVFEGFAARDAKTKYPLCVAGARACPPEDCGGPWGYDELLDAIRDPKHKRHEDVLDWIGEIDPERFDAQAATKAMRAYA